MKLVNFLVTLVQNAYMDYGMSINEKADWPQSCEWSMITNKDKQLSLEIEWAVLILSSPIVVHGY